MKILYRILQALQAVIIGANIQQTRLYQTGELTSADTSYFILILLVSLTMWVNWRGQRAFERVEAEYRERFREAMAEIEEDMARAQRRWREVDEHLAQIEKDEQ